MARSAQRVEFAAGEQPWAVAVGDFNLDGKVDIVTANTVNRVNLTIPAYQTMYMNEFPPTEEWWTQHQRVAEWFR